MVPRFEINWEVDDGYVGGSRPQSFEVSAEDYEGMTLEDIKDQLSRGTQEEFNHTVTWFSPNLDAVAQAIFEAQETPNESA